MAAIDDTFIPEITDPVDIPEIFNTAKCNAVKAMLEKVYQLPPGFLRVDGFWNESNYLLIELTKELTKGHLSIKQAEMLYSAIYSRTVVSLLRIHELPGQRNWHEAESMKNQIRDDNCFYSKIFLESLERIKKRAFLFSIYIPAEFCSFQDTK
jgi:hypothetical protein